MYNIKSKVGNKTREVSKSYSSDKSKVVKNKKDGTTVSKEVSATLGFVPTARKTKTVTSKDGKVISEVTKKIPYSSGVKKVNKSAKLANIANKFTKSK